MLSGKEIIVTGGFVKTAKLKSEWYDEIETPASFIKELEKGKVRADIFTFRQKLPETKPKYNYYTEYNDLAAIPIDQADSTNRDKYRTWRANRHRPECYWRS